MIRTSFRIRWKYSDAIKLMFLSDMHLQNPLVDIDLLKKDLSAVDDNTYILGVGDWFDSIVLTDPRYVKHSDKTKNSDIMNEAVDEAAELMKPYARHILGIGIGNHENAYLKRSGFDPVKTLCKLLSTESHRIEHLGYSALYHLVFEHEGGGNTRTIDVFQHHGWGRSMQTEGGNTTKFSKMVAKYDADMYVFGHVHERVFKELPTTLGIDRACNWKEHHRYMIITGAYLKTLNDGEYPSYSEEFGLSPCPMGAIAVGIKFSKKNINRIFQVQ